MVPPGSVSALRSEEHTSELQSQSNLVCRLLLEKKKDVILSTTNIYGKHAQVAHEVIQAITGLARSTVYAAIARLEKILHLLRVERKVLCHCHNAINIYHVVIPWRADPLYSGH